MRAASSRPTLGRVIERLGSTLLTPEAGPAASSRIVTTVVMHDPFDPPAVPEGAIVLGNGLPSGDDLIADVRALATAGAAALIVREPVTLTDGLTAAVEEAGIPIYSLIRGASWIQLASMLVNALGLDIRPDDPSGLADPAADLFDLANSIAAMLHAPVTIEDLSSRVVAFSSDQTRTDEARHATILGMQVPATYRTANRQMGVYRRVYSSDSPVFIESIEPGDLPRSVMRVTAGDEVLGSIWAIVEEPLTPQREQGLVESARVVGMTMLRARLTADASQRLRLALVTMLLEGGTRAREAARQLNLGSSHCCVVAIGPRAVDGSDGVAAEAEAQRAAAALAMYLQSLYPRAVAALLGGVTYAVLPLNKHGAEAEGEAVRVAEGFVTRLDTGNDLVAGIGPAMADIGDLPTSRRDADAALRVLRSRPRGGSRAVAHSGVQTQALMLRLADSLADDGIGVGPALAAIRDYDASHRADLEGTLRAWLDKFGDITAAAATVHVHKNTFRYRLARITELARVDLSDPEVRFELMLQLRLFRV